MPDTETARIGRKDMGQLHAPIMTNHTVILDGHKNTPFI